MGIIYKHVMWIVILTALLGISNAQHDHTQHIDVKFISGEARRLAWHKLEDLIKYIDEYSEAVRFVEKKYEDHFIHPKEEDRERLDQVWKEHFEPNYRDTYDRLLIISRVCQDIYPEASECKLEDDIWNDRYDLRGREFRKEFLKEIDKAVEEDVQLVK